MAFPMASFFEFSVSLLSAERTLSVDYLCIDFI